MKNKKSDNLKKTDLPNNFLAEQAVLNILLTNPGLINNVIGYNSIISYEKSIYSKITIDTGKSSVLNSRKIILNKIFNENK